MQLLSQEGFINMNPHAYNQPRLDQHYQFEDRSHPQLKEYMDNFHNLAEEEQLMMLDEANEQGLFEYDKAHSTGRHTYSDIDLEDMKDPYEDEDEEHDDPNTWKVSPEELKKREEVRKKIFNPSFKDCDCCKGFIFSCSNEMCIELGTCHCVVNREIQEANDPNQIIMEPME